MFALVVRFDCPDDDAAAGFDQLVTALLPQIAAHEPGESVRMTVVRADGERQTLTVKLGRVPDATG